MDDACSKMIQHIGRLQGQLESVKKELAHGESAECGKASRTLLSSLRSFEGLRTSFITLFLTEKFLSKRGLTSADKAELHDLLALIKG